MQAEVSVNNLVADMVNPTPGVHLPIKCIENGSTVVKVSAREFQTTVVLDL